MSNLSLFLKENKKKKENKKYAVTASICDENGTPVEWEFQHVDTKKNEALQEKCTSDVQVTGKPNMFRPKLNTSRYLPELICAATVFPNLNDAKLQDSYGVKTPVDLLFKLVDDPGEYQDLCLWIQQFHGFKTMQEKVDEAKN